MTIKIQATGLALFLAFAAFGQHDHKQVVLNTQIDSLSYALGINVASSLKNSGIDTLNFDVLKQAMEDIIVNNHSHMQPEVSNQVVNSYLSAKEMEKSKEAIEAGSVFLASNALKEGVVSLPSGLQYKVLVPGSGDTAKDGQRVRAHYEGKLLDGTIFDSSYERGKPLDIGVNQVIPGWTEALKMMPEGSIWELYIPQNLGYGARDNGKIPPYSLLIFKVELIEVL